MGKKKPLSNKSINSKPIGRNDGALNNKAKYRSSWRKLIEIYVRYQKVVSQKTELGTQKKKKKK